MAMKLTQSAGAEMSVAQAIMQMCDELMQSGINHQITSPCIW